MRVQCPRCQAWLNAPDVRGDTPHEQTCSACGALLSLQLDDSADPPRWSAIRAAEPQVRIPSETGLHVLLQGADALDPPRRAERLTSCHAQVVSFTTCLSPRLWGPATLLVAAGLGAALGLVLVGQRIAPALSLILAPVALGGVAWVMTLAATAVAQLVDLRRAGSQAGMGHSLRLLLEHGSGAAGSALRMITLGVMGSSLCLAFALLGAAPGLGGGSGIAVTGGLLWLQLGAVLLGLLVWLATGMALLLHTGMVAARNVDGGRLFRFLLRTMRQDGRVLIARASRPMGGAALLLASTVGLLALALRLVAALNARLLGSGWEDLVSASPIRVLFGAPELVDPSAALGLGGAGMALSLVAIAAVTLGLVAAYLGVSGYLLGRALHLGSRAQSSAGQSR